jgi:hypothetical protein
MFWQFLTPFFPSFVRNPGETHFTKLHEKREEGFYQSLFLNKRLINPLDLAFQLDPVTGNLPTGEFITDHHPVILATLGLREADLILLKELTKASDGTPYITDDLTLDISRNSQSLSHKAF